MDLLDNEKMLAAVLNDWRDESTIKNVADSFLFDQVINRLSHH